MARHACVDLCLVFWLPPRPPRHDRLTAEEAKVLLDQTTRDGVQGDGAQSDAARSAEQVARLAEIRVLYEPFLEALSERLSFRVPRFFPDRPRPDNWQTTAWTERAPGITELPAGRMRMDEHFG